MIPQFIVTSILLILPFITLPFGVTHFETPKVIIFEISTIILAALSLLLQKKLHLGKSIILFGILFVLTFCDLVFRHTTTSFFGNPFRLQGIFLFWMLMFFSIFSGLLGWFKPPRWVFVLLLVLMCLLAFTGQRSIDGRVVGTIGEPNALAGFILFLWPFAIEKITQLKVLGKENKGFIVRLILVNSSILVTTFIVYLTGSRSGMLGLGLQLLLLLLTVFRVSIAKSTILCVFLFVLSLWLPLLEKPNLQNQYENRPDVWKAALIGGFAHPILGWGFGNVEEAMKVTDHKLWNRVQGYYVDSSHNIFLDMWIEGGFIGLVTFLLLLYETIRVFVRNRCNTSLIQFFGLLACLSFNPGSVVELIGLWWLIGYVLHRNYPPEPV